VLQTTSGRELVEYLDPDGDCPFYAFENSNAPSWRWVAKQTGGNFELYSFESAALSMEPSQAPKVQPAPTREERERQAGPPPRRDELRFREMDRTQGDRAFRADRRAWFQRFTGVRLEGTLADQNEQCDAIARRFRGYSDFRLTVWDRWADQ
tara:strand:+ start:61 stop:516 length:456 start_codon:yes stop_codon:yes gene_type:complete